MRNHRFVNVGRVVWAGLLLLSGGARASSGENASDIISSRWCGEEVDADGLKGNVTVLFFWQPYCGT